MKFSFKHTLFVTASVLFVSLASAQTPIMEAVRTAEINPQWPGCTAEMAECSKNKLTEFIAANIQTPPEAKSTGAGGVVLVEFVIEKKWKYRRSAHTA